MRWLFEIVRRILAWIVGIFRGGGGGQIPDDKCCHLARPDKECNWSLAKSNYSCPQGFYKQSWYCCEGTQQVGCGECTTNQDTCWSGDFACSIWWYSGKQC